MNMFKTVLVTGGAGYIGSHMVKALAEAGHLPIVLDNLSKGHRDAVLGGTFVKGDIDDRRLLYEIFTKYDIDAVMHFAGYIEVGESVADPLKYYRNNFTSTAILVESMLRFDVRRFIFSSSAAVYGEPNDSPIDESHPCNPTSPYGESKLYVEKLLESCRIAHGLQYASLRYFNAAGADPSGLIGERHYPESHLIPLILDAATGERDAVHIYGTDYPIPDGTCIRDYVHVNDLVQAHLLALERLVIDGRSGIYNIGNSRGYSIKEVIETIEHVTGLSLPVVQTRRRPGDPAELVADATKIRAKLDWQPQYESLESIVRTAWQWHPKRYAHETAN